MEQAIYSLTISPANMAKRPYVDVQPPSFNNKGDAHGESSGYSRIPKYVAKEEYGKPTREPPIHNASKSTSPAEEFEAGEYCEEYLSSILFDFGLQLSPGGSRVELDQTQSVFNDEVKNELEKGRGVGSDKDRGGSPFSPSSDDLQSMDEQEATATTMAYSKFRKITKFSSKSLHEGKEEGAQTEGLPPLPTLEPIQDKNQLDAAKRKVKKYEYAQQFEDPEEERKRLNAINARRNRMKQKQLTTHLTDSNKNLQEVNQKCSMALKRMISNSQKLEQELEERKRTRAAVEQALREKENEIREQRERLILFRGHLDLIASSLDEDNPAKKLISHLLKKLPCENNRSMSPL